MYFKLTAACKSNKKSKKIKYNIGYNNMKNIKFANIAIIMSDMFQQ